MKEKYFWIILVILLSGCSTKSFVSNLYKNSLFDYDKFSSESIQIIPPRDINISAEEFSGINKQELKEEVVELLKQKLVKAYKHDNIYVGERLISVSSGLMTKENIKEIQKYISSSEANYFVFVGMINIGKRLSMDLENLGPSSPGSTLNTNYVKAISIPIDIWGKKEGQSLLSFEISTEVTNHFLQNSGSASLDGTIDELVNYIKKYKNEK